MAPQVARTRTKAQQRKLRYKSALDDNRDIPAWIDGALKKAVHPDPVPALRGAVRIRLRPASSQQEICRSSAAKPLIERDPLLFWKCLSAILFVALLIALALLVMHYGKH